MAIWLFITIAPAFATNKTPQLQISIHKLSADDATIAEVMDQLDAFIPLAQADLKLTDNPWIKVGWDANQLGDKHYLINDYVSHPKESYFLVRNKQIYQSYHSGHSLDFDSRPITNFKFVMDVSDADYVIVNSCCNPGAPIFYRLLNDTQLQEQYYQGLIWYSVVYAIISVMILYNLFIFIYLRDSKYLYYCYYLGSMLLIQLTLSGIGKQFIWSTFKYTELFYMVASLNVSVASMLFMLSFLDPQHLRKSNKKLIFIVIGLHGIVLLSFVLYFLLPHFNTYANILTQSVCILGWFATNYVIIHCIFRGDKTAKILLLNYLMVNIAGTLFLLRYNAFNYDLNWLENAVDVAVVAEAIILSLALAQRIQNLRKQKRAAELRQLQTQQQFSHRLLEVQENEKRELSSALHDNFTHQLLLLKTALSQKLGYQAKEVQQVGTILDDMRHLSHVIHPYVLDKLGLKFALQEIVNQVTAIHALDVNFAMDGVQLDREQSLLVYRIVQEGLNNIIKHADASECVIALQLINECIVLTIKDDGKGFDHHTCTNQSADQIGFGLSTLQERCEMLHGTLRIFSNTLGTTLLIKFPYIASKKEPEPTLQKALAKQI